MKALLFLGLLVVGSFALENVFKEGDLETLTFKKNSYTFSMLGTSRPQLLCIGDADLCEKYGFDSVTCNIIEWKPLPDSERQTLMVKCRADADLSKEMIEEFNNLYTWQPEKPECEPVTNPSDGRYTKSSCSLVYMILHKEHPVFFNGTHYIIAKRTRIFDSSIQSITFRRSEKTLGRSLPERSQILCAKDDKCPETIVCTIIRNENGTCSKRNCLDDNGHPIKGGVICEPWGENAIVEGSCYFKVDPPPESESESIDISQVKNRQIITFIFACILVIGGPIACCCGCCFVCASAILGGCDNALEREKKETDENSENERMELEKKHKKEWIDLELKHVEEDNELKFKHQTEQGDLLKKRFLENLKSKRAEETNEMTDENLAERQDKETSELEERHEKENEEFRQKEQELDKRQEDEVHELEDKHHREWQIQHGETSVF